MVIVLEAYVCDDYLYFQRRRSTRALILGSIIVRSTTASATMLVRRIRGMLSSSQNTAVHTARMNVSNLYIN